MNRLKTATGGAPCNYEWQYDIGGNMTDKTPTSGTGCTMLDVVVTNKNQISGGGYAYDAAGNMTQMPATGGTLTYDAENRLVTASGGTYTYDGDGRRVKKVAGGPTTTTYSYGVDGHVLWEAVNGACHDSAAGSSP